MAPCEKQPLVKGAAEAAIAWCKQGWSLYGVTNQKGVLCGFKTLEDMIAEQQRTMQLLPWMRVVHACPDEGESCYFITAKEAFPVQESELNTLWKGRFRKPGAGMLMAAIHNYVSWQNSDYRAVMVGDRPEDEEAAKAADIPFLSAEDWRAGKWPEL